MPDLLDLAREGAAGCTCRDVLPDPFCRVCGPDITDEIFTNEDLQEAHRICLALVYDRSRNPMNHMLAIAGAIAREREKWGGPKKPRRSVEQMLADAKAAMKFPRRESERAR